MPEEFTEFRSAILKLANKLANTAEKVKSEASTNIALVQPFLVTLGYDVNDPDEVFPEHHADYSQKYQNKVDYAILHNGAAVVAIESKKVGSDMRDDSGQLRSYFHALQTVKLGILTDGLKYQFFADSDKENVMDTTPFIQFDFSKIAKDNNIDENTLSGIAEIRRGSFNPLNIGAEAKRKLLFESVVGAIKKFKNEPSDEFVAFAIKQSGIGGKISKITQKIIDANRELVRSAMEAFVAQEALSRFGYEPKDVIKTFSEGAESKLISTSATVESDAAILQPSAEEAKFFNYVKDRLIFLVRSEILFTEVQKLAYKKNKNSMRIYYAKPNAGSLVDIYEQKDGKLRLEFPVIEGKESIFFASPEFDGDLLKSFTKRVVDAGIKFESSPVLRSIAGGQSAV